MTLVSLVKRYAPPKEYLLNHGINRLPYAAWRMAAYERLGVTFEDRRTGVLMLGAEVWAPGRLSIGAGTIVGRRTILDCRGGVRLGRSVNIGSEALLQTAKHRIDDPDFVDDYGEIVVGDRAWIAQRAIVLGGVAVGEGAVVVAGAIATRDVAPYTVVAGIPAQPVAERPRDLRYEFDWRPNWL